MPKARPFSLTVIGDQQQRSAFSPKKCHRRTIAHTGIAINELNGKNLHAWCAGSRLKVFTDHIAKSVECLLIQETACRVQ